MSAVEVDFLSESALADPYPAYAHLRRDAPVYWDEASGAWLVTRYGDCVEVLRDSTRFTSDPAHAGVPVPATSYTLQTMDPPEHHALRGLFTAAYRARDLDSLTAGLNAFAASRLTGLAGRRPVDLLADYFKPLALHAITELVGIPETHRTAVALAAEAMAASMDGVFDKARQAAAISSRAALSGIVDRCMRAPGKHGIIAHVARHYREAGVERDVAVHSFRLLLSPGYMSVASAAANAFVTLQAHASRLIDWDEDIAVEELLRFSGPVQALGRMCRDDLDFHGFSLRRGDLVLAMLGSANRDEDRFTDPDQLLLGRRPNPHVAFGWGVHSCLGALLAKVVIRTAIGRLERLFPNVALAGTPGYTDQAVVRCPNTVLVHLEP
ncbi:cytochrome P450 [Amycolatopsis pittospori]|uniref:cytochrome P450 n=1 Tax=Amycolatopsis pittospori TaxID=2749434 RepID=UPI0015F0C1C4|nr:cytochrome P450 [Amycolatopsis pittospori]